MHKNIVTDSMNRDGLIEHFRYSLLTILDKSPSTKRAHLDHLIYQTSPVQSRFANAVVNTAPDKTISPDLIQQIMQYYQELQLVHTWVVHDDDDDALHALLQQHGYTRMMDLDCLHFHGTDAKVMPDDITVKPFTQQQQKEVVKLICDSFDGANPESIEFYLNEVCFNDAYNTECCVAYLPSIDDPVAYGTTTYLDNAPIAMLTGAATLPSFRNQGAYHALINHRINQAIIHGNPHVTIEAISTTSAPICKRYGFEIVCQQTYYHKRPITP